MADQWKVSLNRYHKFAITKLCDFEEEERSAMLGQIVAQWLRDHPQNLAAAGASPEEWQAVRKDWQPPVLRKKRTATTADDPIQ